MLLVLEAQQVRLRFVVVEVVNLRFMQPLQARAAPRKCKHTCKHGAASKSALCTYTFPLVAASSIFERAALAFAKAAFVLTAPPMPKEGEGQPVRMREPKNEGTL